MIFSRDYSKAVWHCFSDKSRVLRTTKEGAQYSWDCLGNFCPSWDTCDVFRDLVPLVPLKKREKHPWRSVNFSKVVGFKPATLLKLTLPPWVFFTFFKLCKWYQIARRLIHENPGNVMGYFFTKAFHFFKLIILVSYLLVNCPGGDMKRSHVSH